MGNIFELGGIGDFSQEVVEVLLKNDRLRIERIVSTGQVSADDFWYEQAEDEWVVVLQGNAVLEFEDHEYRELQRGDFLLIPAWKRHRVQYTSSESPCIWLAVFSKTTQSGN